MKHVLLPIDGSTRSLRTIDMVQQTYRPQDTEVTLLGSPGPEIVYYARERGFDALVMTRSSRGPLQKLGSVATYVVRNAQFLDLIIMREAAP